MRTTPSQAYSAFVVQSEKTGGITTGGHDSRTPVEENEALVHRDVEEHCNQLDLGTPRQPEVMPPDQGHACREAGPLRVRGPVFEESRE